jgi:hypothetical protein
MSSHDSTFSSHPTAVRLRLRPIDNTSGALLDGGWWPRSREPVAELKLLIPAMDRWRNQIMSVSLSHAGWDSHPIRLRLNDRWIPLHWLGLYHDLLIGTYTDRRQVRLLVIPPDTREPDAATAMAAALDPANETPPLGILARRVANPTRSAGHRLASWR